MGINYDKKTKAHQCVIERVENNESQNVGKNVGKTGPKTGPKSGPKSGPKNLPLRQARIVQMIRDDIRISQREIARQLDVSRTTIQADLKKIEHIVAHVGPTNGGEWKFVGE